MNVNIAQDKCQQLLIFIYFIKLKKVFVKSTHCFGRQEKDLFIEQVFITQILYGNEEWK